MSIKRFTAKQIANMRDRTDWERLRNMKDEDIDLSDIPELSEESIRGMVRIGPKVPISLRLDPEVVEWFKRGGPSLSIAHERGVTRLRARAKIP